MRRWAAGGLAVVVAATGFVGGAPAVEAADPPPLSAACAGLNDPEYDGVYEGVEYAATSNFAKGEEIVVTAAGTPTAVGLVVPNVPTGTPHFATVPATLRHTVGDELVSTAVWGVLEGTATFTVSCGRTQAPPPPASGYSVADLSLNEGDGGVNTPKIAKFTITRTGDLSTAGSIAVHTESGTSGNRAIQDKDFKKRDTILQFPAGVSSVQLEVKIIGDLIDEPTERFRVVIEKPVGGAVTDHLGIGTIVDDD